MDEVQFQKEVFKLRDQEYPYYYQVEDRAGLGLRGLKPSCTYAGSLRPSLPPSPRPCCQNNKQRLPALPDLSDMSGGLSNPAYFNFISYILWKVRAPSCASPAWSVEDASLLCDP